MKQNNAANRKIIRDLLGKHGYRIIEALNGEEAVEMDIQSPKISQSLFALQCCWIRLRSICH